jgi:membrane-bound serine protease (ClpP class)
MLIRRIAVRVLLAAVVTASVCAACIAEQALVLTVQGEIGRGTVSYVRSGLDAAEDAAVDLVIVRLTTPGGLLDSAYAIRDLILASSIPSIAYVDREAFSAGALIALACETIVFAPGAVMGAASAVQFDLQEGYVDAPEKVQSAVRTLFRATAEARGRDPDVAEAMVDPSIEIAGLVESGKLLTLTAQEALAWGFADAETDSLDLLLAERGASLSEAVRFERRTIDRVVETMTSPALAALLLIVGLLGLIVEMMIPGFGVAGVIGALCLGAFFWSHVLVGLAGWESIAFLLGGLLAVVFEIFVFTAADFGLAGIAGLILIGLGFYSSMVGPFTDRASALRAIGIVSAGVVFALVVAVILISRIPRSRLRLGGVILSAAVTGKASVKSRGQAPTSEWIDRTGVAATDLHPVGAGQFGSERVDVVCEEGFLAKGTPIVVVKDEGYRKVVRQAKED